MSTHLCGYRWCAGECISLESLFVGFGMNPTVRIFDGLLRRGDISISHRPFDELSGDNGRSLAFPWTALSPIESIK